MSEWISVEDGLPDLDTWVVARNGNHRPFTCRLTVLHNDMYHGQAYLDADNNQRSPTHWAEIPETRREGLTEL